ncbi:hypothetical protein BDZ97DRAFT_1674510 [Flammula alnicola]|nr:hypothetical protein BDZ97DRAFT_1674510 [Flammula alnicola]
MGHFKIAICDLLFPKDAVVVDDAFEMTWTIPRIAPGPFALNTDAHYAQLINKVSKKSPMARIIVNEVQKTAEPNKENVPETPARDRAEGQAKPKAKSKARKEADILPANQAINDTIKSLREHWQCSLTTCKHDYCYIPADGPHFPLSHEHCEKWAAAILRGPTSATLDKPPNIQLFDPVSPHTIVSKSPILQARLNAKEKRDAPQQPPPPQPILQAPPVHIYNYQQPPVGVFGPAAGIAAAIPNNQTGLIPVGCAEGIKLDLLTFCTCYNIADDIRERLQLHRITGTHAFGHLSGDDLKEMGFKVGEIIDVKQAVKEWAVPMD